MALEKGPEEDIGDWIRTRNNTHLGDSKDLTVGSLVFGPERDRRYDDFGLLRCHVSDDVSSR